MKRIKKRGSESERTHAVEERKAFGEGKQEKIRFSLKKRQI